jgi:hypothetical protein
MRNIPAQNDEHITDRIVNFIEKWTLFFLVLLPYWFFSYKIIEDIAYPDLTHRECGNGSFSMLPGHLFMAGLVTVILGLRLWFGKGYGIKAKLLVLALIFLPVLISFAVFELSLHQ